MGVSFSKSFKKDNVKNIRNKESDFNYDGNYKFYRFGKGHDEFEEMSLDSKYNRIKEFTKLLTNFKNLKPKSPKTQLEKERIMKMLMSFTKSNTILTKMIMTMMMSK